MFFSISIPVYNAEKYLEKCIQSVINQSEQDFELVLVDDGSKDSSALICQKWCDKYPNKINFIKKENTGSLYTRRVCLENSKGKYLYIIDADDYLMHTDVLKLIKSNIEKFNCDLVFFNATTNQDKYFNYPWENETVFENEDLKKIYKEILTTPNMNTLWNKVFNRDIVDWEADYSKLDHVTNGTDFHQMLPIISNAKKLLYIDKILYFYRIEGNNESIVHKFRETVFASSKAHFYELCEYINMWQMDSENIPFLLSLRYMKIASTSANKVVLIKKGEKFDVVKYLQMIGEDEDFRKYYTLKGLPIPRKIIVFMLYHRLYKLLYFCFNIIRMMKK